MKIAVDLDGTLFPTYEVLGRGFLEIFGEEINWESFKLKNGDCLKTEQDKWLKRRFKDEKFFRSLTVMPYAKGALNYLASAKNGINQIIYWTSRPGSVEKATIYSLEANGLPFGKVYHVNRKDAALRKLNIARAERINVAIEDESEVAEKLSDFCKVVLFHNPHNKHCLYGTRIYSWKDIKEFL